MRLLKLMLLSVCVCLAGAAWAAENDGGNRELQLKTAYLFHFAELAQWPHPAPLTLCLQGHSRLRGYLPLLEGQQIDGKAVHVEFVDKPDIDRCRILFLSDLGALTAAVAEQARRSHILLVSDVEQFAEIGGMVQFTLRDNRLKLVVNLAAVKAAELKLSSKLLRMAEILE